MTAEDEAFDDLARRQGMWGGGFPAKRAMAADKVQDGKCKYCVDGCIACDARAQPAQEPVACIVKGHLYMAHEFMSGIPEGATLLYTTPPKRPWVGLTDEEIDKWTPEIHVVIRFVEQLLRERNS